MGMLASLSQPPTNYPNKKPRSLQWKVGNKRLRRKVRLCRTGSNYADKKIGNGNYTHWKIPGATQFMFQI